MLPSSISHRPLGLLRAEDRAGSDDWPPAGAPLMVQVRNDGEGDKGPRLSMNVARHGVMSSTIRRRRASVSRAASKASPSATVARPCRRVAGGRHRAAHRAAGAAPDVLRADANRSWHVGNQLAARLRRPAAGGSVGPHSRRARSGRPACCATRRLPGRVILDERAMARALQDEMDRLARRSACAGTTAHPASTSTTSRARSTPRSPRASCWKAASRCCSSRGETLCAVDVDSAAAGGRQGVHRRRPIDVNLEAAPAIAQQLRLRNIAARW